MSRSVVKNDCWRNQRKVSLRVYRTSETEGNPSQGPQYFKALQERLQLPAY